MLFLLFVVDWEYERYFLIALQIQSTISKLIKLNRYDNPFTTFAFVALASYSLIGQAIHRHYIMRKNTSIPLQSQLQASKLPSSNANLPNAHESHLESHGTCRSERQEYAPTSDACVVDHVRDTRHLNPHRCDPRSRYSHILQAIRCDK